MYLLVNYSTIIWKDRFSSENVFLVPLSLFIPFILRNAVTNKFIRENAFEHKKEKPGLSANRPSNNWAQHGKL